MSKIALAIINPDGGLKDVMFFLFSFINFRWQIWTHLIHQLAKKESFIWVGKVRYFTIYNFGNRY